jgi:hypothetical protein
MKWLVDYPDAVAELGPNFWGGKMGWGGEKMGFRLISGKNLAQYI